METQMEWAVERTGRPQTAVLAVAGVALAALAAGCGPATTSTRSSMGSVSPHPRTAATARPPATSSTSTASSRHLITTLGFVIPRSLVPSGAMLVGAIEVTADGRRVTAVSIVGG